MTGVTVAVLAIGLIATGAGATVFFRNALIANLEDAVRQSAESDIATGLFDIEVVDGVPVATEKEDSPRTDFHVALYASEPPGVLLISGGGGEPAPRFPPEYALEKAYTVGTQAFTLDDDGEKGGSFRASVAPLEVSGTLFTQMVALPVSTVNQTIGTFLGIYSILSVIAIIAGAAATRWLVTLTFRSLGQVESTAMAIAAGDFSQRMTDIEPATTEVGRLKTAINTMLGRVDFAISQRDSSVRQMRRFIGDASHELRTPLVTVRGYAELYRMGAITGEEDVSQAMDRIEKEAVRMGVLVEDLLALARLDERRDVIIGPVDLLPIARDAALDVRATSPLRAVTVLDSTADEPPAPRPSPEDAPDSEQAARRRAGLPTSAIARAGGGALSLLRRKPRPVPAVSASDATDRPPDAPIVPARPDGGASPVVLGDENRIRQVVANLLGNARRFTADDSPIELRIGTDAEAGMGWIEVIDHGDGVPDQIKDKIFQRFWRADTSRARETGGTGLGLSIVASIVEALHGSVGVTDTPGGGATFRVGFPLAGDRDATEHLLIETQPLDRLEPFPD